jgi:hypothetical protein
VLNKDVIFNFDSECLKAFELIKAKLASTHVIVARDWNLNFKLMCDASDYPVRAVLG